MTFRSILLTAALAAIGSIAALGAPPAAAVNHIAGATYNGTESAGGSAVSFAVTGDGAGIANFSIAGPLPGSSCTFSNVQTTFGTPVPIVNDAFTSSSSSFVLAGSFPGPQSAQGTLQVRSTFSGCSTGTVAWSATTTAPPNASGTAPTTQKKKCKKGQKKVKVNGKVKCKKKRK